MQRFSSLIHFLTAAFFIAVYAPRLRAQDKATGNAQFTNEERQGLSVGADSISDIALGFAFPHPGASFTRDYQFEKLLAEEFGGQMPADYLAWMFRDTTHNEAVSVHTNRVPDLNEQGFRIFVNGLKTQMGAATVLQDDFIWNGTRRESFRRLKRPNGFYVTLRCIPRLEKPREDIICLQTLSRDSLALARVSKGLRFSN